MQEFRVTLIRETLEKYAGNRTRTAKALGLQRTYLLRLIRDYEIKIPPAVCTNPAGTNRHHRE